MTMQMSSMLQQAVSDTFLYIGAGHCEDFSDYAALPVEKFLLVEPNPDCLMSLRRIAKKDARVSILPYAVSGAEAPSDLGILHIWNNATFNGLHSTDALHSLLPGLRATAAVEVPLRGIDMLMDKASRSQEGGNILKLEALGENTAILRRLADLSLLDRFEFILLRMPQDPIFDSDETAQVALDILDKAGFDLCEEYDLGLGFASYHLKRNPFRLESEELERRLAEITLERDAAVSARTAELEAAQAHEAEQTKTREALEAEVAVHQDRVMALQVDLEKAVQRAETAEDAVAQRDAALKETMAALSVAESDLATQTETVQDFEEKAVAWEETLDALRDRLEQKDSELSIALRTQAAVQSDLMNLRTRYETLREEKGEADALLFQVTERLHTASGYLQQLNRPAEVSTAKEEDTPDSAPKQSAAVEEGPRPKERGTGA